MYFDKQNMFSDKQAVTATAAAADTVDLGPGDIGPSGEASLYVGASGYTGAGTLVVELQTADAVDAAGVLTSPVTVATYSVTNAALLAGGKIAASRLPHGMKRYAGLKYTVTGTLAGGTLTAGIVLDV